MGLGIMANVFSAILVYEFVKWGIEFDFVEIISTGFAVSEKQHKAHPRLAQWLKLNKVCHYVFFGEKEQLI